MLQTIDPNFWRNKRIFITGHTGFIGGWLYLWLHELGAKITGYALPPIQDPNFFETTELNHLGNSHLGDIRDYEKLRKVMVDANPDIIIHLAAQALVRTAYKDPVDTFSTNVMGTVNVLQAARECKNLQNMLIFTTDKVYENIEQNRGYAESDRLGGLEPYGASKACTEIVAQSYWHSYFKNPLIPMATMRSGNVIGGGDWSIDRLIPDAVRACEMDQPLTLRHPEAVRPWQHVLEPCYGILRMIQYMHDKKPHLFGLNIGPDAKECQTVGWIADRFVQEWNKHEPNTAKWQHVPDDKIYEAKLLMLDNGLARSLLNWAPHWKAQDAIHHTVNWYIAHRQGRDMRDFSIQQIQNFITGANHG